MKDFFESVWREAPRLISVIFIFACMFFICLQASQFYLKIESMDARLGRVEKKVDMIIDYLLADRATRNQPSEKPTGK